MADIDQIKQTMLEHGYEYQRTIGAGGFSTVYLCYSIKYDQEFAVKCTRKEGTTRYEFDTLITLNHPNIIRIYDAFEDENSQYFVMEYCSNGTILQKGKLTYEQFVYYSRQIIDALQYCHSKKIAHRDIKPENILIDGYNNVKLADFGIARNFKNNEKSNEKSGTIKYFAPEMFLFDEICPFKADVWALGITFFVMATGKFPFNCYSRQKLKQSILIGELDFIKNKIDKRIQFLISKMSQIQPKLRPSMKKLLEFDIFKLPNDNVKANKSLLLDRNKIKIDNNNAAPLTKLHSYRSINHLPNIQQINGHLMFNRI